MVYMNEATGRICSACGARKELTKEFFSFVKKRNVFEAQCKKCVSDKNKIYYQNNRDEKLIKAKTYRKENKEKINSNRRDAYSKYKKIMDLYQENNKEEISEKRRETRKKKYHTDPVYKLKRSISSLVRFIIKKNNKSIQKYLSYTIDELKTHLESLFEPWMNWNNWGVYDKSIWDDNNSSTWTWQLDHIIPQSDLPYASMRDENFKICWSISNLRPYSAKNNSIDGARRTRHR
jgi:hypothetical protein